MIDPETTIKAIFDNGNKNSTVKGFLIPGFMRFFAEFEDETNKGVAIYPNTFQVTGSEMTLEGSIYDKPIPLKGGGPKFENNNAKLEFVFENKGELSGLVIGQQTLNIK